ncbi:MAG: RIP metalloprotease RseP [Rhodocyclaceae bacterium]|nr:RIP metalloprotease RseP [Rhodocyclaceae bacterium]
MMQTLLAFILTLAILVVVHELGHYLAARALGVRVLRFSVGFGRPLYVHRSRRSGTEWVLAGIPLGGYVKMLDEREGPVAVAERPHAFNVQPVWKRFVIVLAGPISNLLLAVVAYSVLNTLGVPDLRPMIAAPPAHSAAADAGFARGDLVRRVADQDVASWSQLRWQLLRALLSSADTVAVVAERDSGQRHVRSLSLARVDRDNLERDLLDQLGLQLFRPPGPALIGRIVPGQPADRAGLRTGDQVRSVDGQAIEGAAGLVAIIRAHAGTPIRLEIERGTELMQIDVTPEATGSSTAGRATPVGRIGAEVRDVAGARDMLRVTLSYGPLEAIVGATRQTFETAAFSIQVLGRMVTGSVSWKNLSGPVAIADYAGQSVGLGAQSFVRFLALLSISLAVLNLLPIPLLDGGHLMYYLIEMVRGRPLSDWAMEVGQRIGFVLLGLLMVFALFNDLNRLLSG